MIPYKRHSSHCIPGWWKTYHLIPVPTKPVCTVLNDLRPVALTSIPMKTLERLVLSKLRPLITRLMKTHSSSHSGKRFCRWCNSVFFFDSLYRHLDHISGHFARVLFVDFSSAFNTILPHILIDKMFDYGINFYLTKWVIDFLTNRVQKGAC